MSDFAKNFTECALMF